MSSCFVSAMIAGLICLAIAGAAVGYVDSIQHGVVVPIYRQAFRCTNPVNATFCYSTDYSPQPVPVWIKTNRTQTCDRDPFGILSNCRGNP